VSVYLVVVYHFREVYKKSRAGGNEYTKHRYNNNNNLGSVRDIDIYMYIIIIIRREKNVNEGVKPHSSI
jgi:hypothetical protein